jgi:hypothetical protein
MQGIVFVPVASNIARPKREPHKLPVNGNISSKQLMQPLIFTSTMQSSSVAVMTVQVDTMILFF